MAPNLSPDNKVSRLNPRGVPMFLLKQFALAAILGLLSGCAMFPIGSINDSAKSALAPNLVPIGPVGKYSTRNLLYESQTIGSIEVTYNLYQGYILQNQLYWLTLVIKNKGDAAAEVAPIVELQDTGGIEIPAHTYNGFMYMASSLATGAPIVIPTAPTTQSVRTTHSGTVTSTSGNTYYYSGTSRSRQSGAESFAAGMSQFAAATAASQAREMTEGSQLLSSWADSYWLRDRYTIKSGGGVVGTLTFPAPKATPLILQVSIGDKKYRFVTGKELVSHD